jgi:hypothetical protein
MFNICLYDTITELCAFCDPFDELHFPGSQGTAKGLQFLQQSAHALLERGRFEADEDLINVTDRFSTTEKRYCTPLRHDAPAAPSRCPSPCQNSHSLPRRLSRPVCSIGSLQGTLALIGARNGS